MKAAIVILSILLAGAMAFSVYCVGYIAREKEMRPNVVVFPDANSRLTYFDVHNVGRAQELSKGQGVKVGIMDSYFGLTKHQMLYAVGADFLADTRALNEESGHGFWMATVLRETAPEAEIYALNTGGSISEDRKTRAMVAAIDWAIANGLDILTYSAARLGPENEEVLDQTVTKAAAHGIITVFIHYPNAHNILPDGLWASGEAAYNGREADVHIFHYDYNVINVPVYLRSQEGGEPRAGDDIPFLSISSTAPITAGIIAMMRRLSPDLTPADCKRILIETSRPYTFEGRECPRVPDAYAAVKRADQAG